jgi:hypothetical protein
MDGTHPYLWWLHPPTHMQVFPWKSLELTPTIYGSLNSAKGTPKICRHTNVLCRRNMV